MELAHPKKTNVNNTSPLVLITHYKQQAKNPNYSETGVCVCVCVCVCRGGDGRGVLDYLVVEMTRDR